MEPIISNGRHKNSANDAKLDHPTKRLIRIKLNANTITIKARRGIRPIRKRTISLTRYIFFIE